MNRYIKITIFTLVCFCFNINKMYACDEDPIPVITSTPNTYKIFMKTTDSKILGSNSYDPDDGTNPGDGIEQWKWDIFDYNEGDGYFKDEGKDVNSSTTFSPVALGLGAGRYGVDLIVKDNDNITVNGYEYYGDTRNWCGTRDFYVPGIKYLRDQWGDDEHYLPTGTGETFKYYLLPAEGADWEPEMLCLYIRDASGNYAYTHFLFGSIVNDPNIPLKGDSAILIWDGIGNYGAYNDLPLPPGNYTVTLYIRKGSITAYETNPLTIFDVRITGIEGTTGNVLGYDIGGTFIYDVRPDSGWSGSEPDAVSFGILDSYNNVVYWTNEGYAYMSTSISDEPGFTWNGYEGNNTAYYYPAYPGKYYLKVCVEKNGYYYYSEPYEFYIVEVDLDISGVDDYYEEGTGGFIALNDDDDNNNDTADKSETGPVTNEDNLIAITLQKVQPIELTGNVTLKATAEGSKVRIWESSTKGGSPITLPETYATPTALPKTLYVEGYDTSGSVRDIELTLEFTIGDKTFDDKIKMTVIDVVSVAVDASDTDSHKIASVKTADKIPDDHFVTVKGLAGNITLLATISPDTTETKAKISWTNMTQDGTNKLKATKSRSTSGKFPATVNVGGKDARDLTDWVIWANLVGNVQNPNITSVLSGGLRVGTEICADYTCTATLTPSEICDITKDIPDLQGAKNCDPPGGTNVVGTPLSGGATLKWDMSRRISRQMNVNATNPALTLIGLDQNIAFPADNRIGNDDTSVVDENNDPYNSTPLGIITSMDKPTRSIALQGGNIGQTYENLTYFQEFARLNLGNSWYVISDSEAWSVQFRFIKVQVTEALWNVDANGDGDKLDNITEAMLGMDTNGDGDQNDSVGYWGNNASTSSN